ncbi:hypothetical protein CC78DRAFT_564894 [Lojkania enalia]|uniref:CwfJ domain-containing protein n=1 Tax=Lojkania enalia TaxID=147567 RepID=A0A9P4N9L3_9PLEO|nr:hypothetical protein CC78DRAFT_564894 [Didymosphaeria enalia]
MASKIAVIGAVDGQFRTVFQKVADLHAKHSFAFTIITGNLFADPATATEEHKSDVNNLIKGTVHIPLATYFALGTHPLPNSVVEKLKSSNNELCHNLFFLGKISFSTTLEGIRIAAVGGTYNPKQADDDYIPFYNETDTKGLQGNKAADILITNEWPAGVRSRSRVHFDAAEDPPSQPCLADLCTFLKPRYHFSTSGTTFYEREPFFHLPSEETDGLYPTTRFISLASFGNRSKQKWIYAFTLDPSASHPVSAEPGSTASPFALLDKKRNAPTDRESAGLVFEDHHGGGRQLKRRRRHKGPLQASECFFCIANNHATHLVTTIGEYAYMTTAKGPLSNSGTFPGLDFPCHMLIIPLFHTPTLASIGEKRHKTYAEMQQFRASMNRMLKFKTGNEYGSVTWEVSKANFPHTHWQYLPVSAELIHNGLLEGAFRIHADNEKCPRFKKEDVGDGVQETGDFFRVLIWDPLKPEDEYTSLIMRFDDSIKFRHQFGREVLAKLMRLDNRIDWHQCGQLQNEEEADVAAFNRAFKDFEFTTEE